MEVINFNAAVLIFFLYGQSLYLILRTASLPRGHRDSILYVFLNVVMFCFSLTLIYFQVISMNVLREVSNSLLSHKDQLS